MESSKIGVAESARDVSTVRARDTERLVSMLRQCSIPGCERSLRSRTWCNKHYKRWLNHGDPLVNVTHRGVPIEERFWLKVEKTEGCWLWTGFVDRFGYGFFRFDGLSGGRAHRYAYKLLVGPLSDDLSIDFPFC